MIDLKAIRAAAEAATPGPWLKQGGQLFGSDHSPVEAAGLGIGLGAADKSYGSSCKREQNTAFIRATDPAAILELLDRLEAAEKDAARYRWLKRERKTENYEGELAIEFECGFDHWNDIDAAIDAAMKDEQK